MHPSEREVADVLDALHVAWDYEPRMFELEVKENGHVASGFRPDFYLPEHDLYLEVTKAKVMTDKNRKVRLLRETHPDVQIELIGRHDFANLRAKVESLIER